VKEEGRGRRTGEDGYQDGHDMFGWSEEGLFDLVFVLYK
jgi:hypothetical protein